MAQKYKRRNIFIKKDFQGKLILGYFLFVTGGCLFFLFLLGLFSADTLTLSYNNHDLQLGQTPIMLVKQTLAAHWVFIVTGSAFLVVAAMLITHRIAGPLFRLEKALDSMLNGRLDDTIYLRTNDEGKDIARKINDFNADLSLTVKNLQGNADAITSLLEQARLKTQSLGQDQQDELQAIYWNIDEKNKRIKAICSAYTLKDV
ncbi:MAG: methyl-accepting chemotaxis protein [Proteobacteria bacterium]|nr:methyl-accepting chemotaxis protein [Pseudomonadota bacterium]